MADIVRIELTVQKPISQTVRNPGFVLLEAPCPANVTAQDIDKACRLGQVKIISAAPPEEKPKKK